MNLRQALILVAGVGAVALTSSFFRTKPTVAKATRPLLESKDLPTTMGQNILKEGAAVVEESNQIAKNSEQVQLELSRMQQTMSDWHERLSEIDQLQTEFDEGKIDAETFFSKRKQFLDRLAL
jgi:hypothetical protein